MKLHQSILLIPMAMMSFATPAMAGFDLYHAGTALIDALATPAQIMEQMDALRFSGSANEGRLQEMLKKMSLPQIESEVLAKKLMNPETIKEASVDLLVEYYYELRHIDNARTSNNEIAPEALRAGIRRQLYDLGFSKADAEVLSKILMTSKGRTSDIIHAFERDTAFKTFSEIQRKQEFQLIEEVKNLENKVEAKEKLFVMIESMGYRPIPAEYIAHALLTETGKTVAEVFQMVDAMMGDTGGRTTRAAEAMKESNSGKIDPKASAERAGRK